MHTVHRLTATVALAAITLVGGASGASAVSSSPSGARLVTTSAALTSAAAPTAASVPSSAVGLITATSAAAPSAPAAATAALSPLSIARAIISVISRFSGWLSKLATAVNRGYTAYRTFINGLPWYIAVPLKAVSPLLLTYDVWSALNSLL